MSCRSPSKRTTSRCSSASTDQPPGSAGLGLEHQALQIVDVCTYLKPVRGDRITQALSNLSGNAVTLRQFDIVVLEVIQWRQTLRCVAYLLGSDDQADGSEQAEAGDPGGE